MSQTVTVPDSQPRLRLEKRRPARRILPSPVITSRPERIPALDGLRGVAIFLVLLRHSIAGTPCTSKFWLWSLQPLRLTWSGVDLFFVLSGFLIGGILLDARRSPHYFRTFYLRRAFRIFPAYALFLLIYLGRHLPFSLLGRFLGQTSPLAIPWFSFVTLTQNCWMAALGWFGPLAAAPTWSLAVEEQFYLSIPFLIRRCDRRCLLIALTGIIFGAPLLRTILPNLFSHGELATYVLTPCRADSLGLGVLSALIVRNERLRSLLSQRKWILRGIAATAFVGVVYLTYYGRDQYTPPISTWGFSCLAVFYSAILLAAVCRANQVLRRVLCASWLRNLGTIAYTTYLFHMLFIIAIRGFIEAHWHLSPAATWAFGGVAGVLCSIVIASVSWKYLEKPLIRFSHKFQY